MVRLHAEPARVRGLVSPHPTTPPPGQGSAPSGAPSHTTSSACWPSKWEITSLAVASLVMSPCGRAAGEQGLLMRSGPQSADAAEMQLPVGSPHCSWQVALCSQSMHACRCDYTTATCVRAPAAVSRPQWAPSAAGPPPQSWAAPPRSSLSQQPAGRAGGTAPACSGVAATACCLRGACHHDPKAWQLLATTVQCHPMLRHPPGTTSRGRHTDPPRGARLQSTGGGRGTPSAAQTLVAVNGGPGGCGCTLPCRAMPSCPPPPPAALRTLKDVEGIVNLQQLEGTACAPSLLLCFAVAVGSELERLGSQKAACSGSTGQRIEQRYEREPATWLTRYHACPCWRGPSCNLALSCAAGSLQISLTTGRPVKGDEHMDRR